MKWTVLVAALLAGCAAPQGTVRIVSGSPSSGVFVQASSTAGFATLGLLVGLAIIALSTDDLRGGQPDGSRSAPELDPNRTINEVDCSQPIDFSKGNIRCK